MRCGFCTAPEPEHAGRDSSTCKQLILNIDAQLQLSRWEDGEPVTAHLLDLDRAQVQAAEHLTLQLPGDHGVVTLQQRVRHSD